MVVCVSVPGCAKHNQARHSNDISHALTLSMVALRAIQGTEHCLYCSELDIRIGCSAKACCARGCLDLDIGYSLCSGSLLERMLCIGEYLKISYIALVERLHKSVNGAVATTTQFTHDTINGDAGCTCN